LDAKSFIHIDFAIGNQACTLQRTSDDRDDACVSVSHERYESLGVPCKLAQPCAK
jgi:hypothetical protein